MKKGFTLAELLGVITLLAIVCLIAFPPILNSIKKSKQNLNDSNNKIIYSATKTYMENHPSEVVFTDNKFCVQIKTLMDAGELMSNLIDPNTNEVIDSSKYVKVINSSSDYEYFLVPNNGC